MCVCVYLNKREFLVLEFSLFLESQLSSQISDTLESIEKKEYKLSLPGFYDCYEVIFGIKLRRVYKHEHKLAV